MAKGNTRPANTSLKQGRNHSPSGVDKSMKCTGKSVNAGSTRSATAKTPRTLGPREA